MKKQVLGGGYWVLGTGYWVFTATTFSLFVVGRSNPNMVCPWQFIRK
ncbi:hypothetical protein [Desulfocicer vacuolatum]|nr:hypothetical protein [Desulfocicer vacuolatum]